MLLREMQPDRLAPLDREVRAGDGPHLLSGRQCNQIVAVRAEIDLPENSPWCAVQRLFARLGVEHDIVMAHRNGGFRAGRKLTVSALQAYGSAIDRVGVDASPFEDVGPAQEARHEL